MSDNVALFTVDPALTQIAAAYRNESMIADEVLPRVPVGVQNFKYRKWALEDGFTVPNTTVGRTSRVNQVEFGFSDADSSCMDYGLEEPVPQNDIDNAPAGYNPLERAAASAMDLILLDREIRAANLVFNADTYAATNKETLSGTGQFSDPASDPIGKILAALDKCVMRPNVMVLGTAAWTALRQHPKVVKATHGNAGDSGVAAREAVRELLEIQKLVVGQGWVNVAKKGQKATVARVWGKHIALIYQDTLADTRGRVTFGFTAQWRDREVASIPDANIGARGGIKVRVTESVRELVIANDLGYFIQNAVA
jgi:hypothetical protein